MKTSYYDHYCSWYKSTLLTKKNRCKIDTFTSDLRTFSERVINQY